jgi:hypothetical protein
MEQAADAIRGSRSKISRMEHGRVSFKERDITDLLTLYAVTSRSERAGLLALAREADGPGWWQGYADILPNWLEPYFALEAAASVIRTYELQFIPGLLQTEDYARAVIRLGNPGSEEDVARHTEIRMSRQDILQREDPPHLWAVVDEGILRRPIGGKMVLREQVRHLITMAEHPAVTLQILPFQAGVQPTMGAFTLLRFAEPDLRDVVHIEHLASALYIDRATDVAGYLDAMDQLIVHAQPAAKTPELLNSMLGQT